MESMELLHLIEGINRDSLDLIAWNLLSELSDEDCNEYIKDHIEGGE